MIHVNQVRNLLGPPCVRSFTIAALLLLSPAFLIEFVEIDTLNTVVLAVTSYVSAFSLPPTSLPSSSAYFLLFSP